jgi:hypothetical protein
MVAGGSRGRKRGREVAGLRTVEVVVEHIDLTWTDQQDGVIGACSRRDCPRQAAVIVALKGRIEPLITQWRHSGGNEPDCGQQRAGMRWRAARQR